MCIRDSLQAVFDRAVGLRLADAQRVAPVMRRAPIPAFLGVGIVMDARHADRIGEAVESGKVVADIAPGVVRAMRGRNRARSVLALAALDLAGDQIDRLV